MKNKPRSVDSWNLDNKSKRVVKKELDKWLSLFIGQADGREGSVYRADFINDDFFFYTECNDLVSEEVESTNVEASDLIRTRKRKVVLQLFVKTLLGEELGKKIKCSHCGFEDMKIESCEGIVFRFCPKCFLTSTLLYPSDYYLFRTGALKMIKKYAPQILEEDEDEKE